jgi:20S proteasome alpha/beta subunit
MTLCIAAVARDKGIIAVSDMRFDLGYTSGDGMPKMGRLNRYWAAMFAGNDVSNAPMLLANVEMALSGDHQKATRRQVEKLFRDEYRAALAEQIEAEVLSPFKLTVGEFTKTGVRRFTPDVFADIATKMSRVELGYEFLVFGFDEKRVPHIFHVQKRGIVQDCRLFGFWAIGSGDTAAVHHMLFHEYNTQLPLRTAAYYACAAKFFAERANLGENTHVVCLMNDGRIIGIDVKKIRKLWQRGGRARIPKWERLPPYYEIDGPIKGSDDMPPGSGLI